MKPHNIKMKKSTGKIFLAIFTAASFFVLLSSFKSPIKLADDFLKQLGISKNDADQKISSSLLGGSLETSDLKNLKKIAFGSRTSIARNVLRYTKEYVQSAAYIKEYNALRLSKKPAEPFIQTPEEMQAGQVEQGKKAVADLEEKIRKANGSTKEIFEKTLQSVRLQIQQAEDPNNKSIVKYRNGYPNLLKTTNENHQKHLAEWEARYPANHLHFVKLRLMQFLEETRNIDFSAETHEIKGIKYFTNKAYEQKSKHWKMGYRAGKEMVEFSRSFVEEWIAFIE